MNIENQAKLEKLSESNVLFLKTEDDGFQKISIIDKDLDIEVGERYVLFEDMYASVLLKNVEPCNVFILKPVEL